MKLVKSKNIHSIHYDEKTKQLDVTFHGNKTYHYDNVAEHTYKAFENAKSHGKFFNDHIRDNYHGRKKETNKKDVDNKHTPKGKLPLARKK